jgi:membrane fusion protein (multidrug efflux system)
VLVEIDAMPEQLQLRQDQVQQQALQPQQTRLQTQIAAEQSGRAEERRSAELSVQEAEARVHEAEFAATFADQELARLRELQAQQMVSMRDLDKAQTEAGRLRAAVSSLKATARRIQQEQAVRERERDTRIERLRGELAALAAQHDKLGADIERRGYEMERRRIRAPVAGTVGEASSLRVGAVVQAGERLGAIVPSGELMVVAQYPAQAAIGRLRAGQAARLRLDAYPWNEFGTVVAEVQRVAQEPRDGRVRVELAIRPNPGFKGVLAHGMPGTLEIAVEQVTPLALLLRTAGQWLTSQR